MRKLLHLFFGLLVPLSMLFIIAAIFYFKLDYSFTKAIRLGVLSGFFIGLFVSFFTAILLLILRKGQQPKGKAIKIKKKHKKTTGHKYKETNNSEDIKSPKTKKSVRTSSPQASTVTKSMLIMDHEIAFEVILYIITEQNIGTLTKSKDQEGYLSVKTKDDLIQIDVSPLTKHTSQVSIKAKAKSESTKTILHYLKEKEHSFLQY